jgi:hypothetical protein
MTNEIHPEPQTIGGCAEKMMECRGEIFGYIDDKHETEMAAIGEVSDTCSYIKGRLDGQASTGSQKNLPAVSVAPVVQPEESKKRDWVEIAVSIFNSWGPYLALILLYGIAEFLKKN